MRTRNGRLANRSRLLGAALILLTLLGCAAEVGGQADPTGGTGNTAARPSADVSATSASTASRSSTTSRSTSSSRTSTPAPTVPPSRSSARSTTTVPNRSSAAPTAPASSFGVDRWIRQGWIYPFDALGSTTFDFTQLAAAGQETVEIRAWQKIGSLGWQSNQLFSYAAFTVSGDTVTMTSATGYRDTWTVTGTATDRITVSSTRLGNVTIYNCTATVWPDLVRSSNRGCR